MSADLLRTIAQANDTFAANHKPSISFSEFPDMKAALIVSCMDPRTNPTDFWNLGGEEGPPIVRNAGGRVTEDTLRSIRVLGGIMGYGKNTIGAVAVIHHTDCGLRNFSNDQIGTLLAERSGLEGEKALDAARMDFGSLTDVAGPEESVKRDMAIIKKDPYLPKDLEIVGFVYDVFSGKTKEVGTL